MSYSNAICAASSGLPLCMEADESSPCTSGWGCIFSMALTHVSSCHSFSSPASRVPRSHYPLASPPTSALRGAFWAGPFSGSASRQAPVSVPGPRLPSLAHVACLSSAQLPGCIGPFTRLPRDSSSCLIGGTFSWGLPNANDSSCPPVGWIPSPTLPRAAQYQPSASFTWGQLLLCLGLPHYPLPEQLGAWGGAR